MRIFDISLMFFLLSIVNIKSQVVKKVEGGKNAKIDISCIDYLDQDFNLTKDSIKYKFKIIQECSFGKPIIKYSSFSFGNQNYRKHLIVKFESGLNYYEGDSLLDGKISCYYYDKLIRQDSFSKGKPIYYHYYAYAAPDNRTRLSYIEKTFFQDNFNTKRAISYKIYSNDFSNNLKLEKIVYYYVEEGRWKRKKVRK